MPDIYNISKLSSKVLPPLPPFPKVPKEKIVQAGVITADVAEHVNRGDKIEQTIFGTAQTMPLSIKLKSESTYWLFPVEPMISVDGKNILIKRNVAKRKNGYGSIKEYWTQDDWVINIAGLLTDSGSQYDYPREDLITLMKYCNAKEPLDVKCSQLELLGINKIVIESFSLPFTKGPENQNYSITALSDTDWSLVLKKKVSVS